MLDTHLVGLNTFQCLALLDGHVSSLNEQLKEQTRTHIPRGYRTRYTLGAQCLI